MRRKVFYIPGFDPMPPRRYRELYRREGAKQARISGYRIAFPPRGDRTGFGWAVTTETDGVAATAEFEVLVWSDIVAQSMGRSIAATYGQLARTAATYLRSGALLRLMRLRRGPVLAALYPVVVLLAQAGVALLAAAAGVALWATVLPWWSGLPMGAALFWLVLRFWRRLDGRIFAYYLMHDYAFAASADGAWPDRMEDRIARFADRVAEAATGNWDEILVIGHSSGASVAVSVLARLAGEGRLPRELALLTLGHVVPMTSFLPGAEPFRRDLRAVAASGVPWVDVTAPGDACSFALCDPVAVSDAVPAGGGGPLVISAAFSRTLSAETRRGLRGRWFRLHFQYLCAFDRPGEYDYFQITAGPEPLGSRFGGRISAAAHSPGRIATVPGNARRVA